MTKYDFNSSDGTVRLAIADQEINIVVYFDKRIAWFEAQRHYMIEFACALLTRAGAKFTIHDDGSVPK